MHSTDTDTLLQNLADYIAQETSFSQQALQSARLSLIDSLACALMALKDPECTKLLGPSVPGADFRKLGAKVLGTAYQLEPVSAAFNVSCMVRWLDFNDTWLAKEWCHPSDNLGAIWALGDYVSRVRLAQNKTPFKVKDILNAMIKAYEVQGGLALCFSLKDNGLDHTLLVRLASAGVGAWMLGGEKGEILSALSHAFIDGGSLRLFRHAPFDGTRQAWAAADASSRGVRLALMALKGEAACVKALSAPTWGFEAVCTQESLKITRPLSSYVVENVLYKISYPVLLAIQTAVECALILHKEVSKKTKEVDQILWITQELTKQALEPKKAQESLLYPVLYALLYGHLDAHSCVQANKTDSRLNKWATCVKVQTSPTYTKEATEPSKRATANALQVFFKDGTSTQKIEVKYPLGHRFRREEGLKALMQKCQNALKEVYPLKKVTQIESLLSDQERLEDMDFSCFCDLLAFV
ncbi:2-methylcitrate dehydratase [Helicobacter ailurogastricus]|uniref:2-methylcitrate dehydratase n=1 Tax=Helicobacter ailurogastricus TaxID=1578720 RepID=UPI00244D9309|nr:2-methylcitrate dehydratase [Helicobacter ailurogastricus]GMB89727.1 2-methylcitrate dehydratase [Helicobacter ailurogastricus]